MSRRTAFLTDSLFIQSRIDSISIFHLDESFTIIVYGLALPRACRTLLVEATGVIARPLFAVFCVFRQNRDGTDGMGLRRSNTKPIEFGFDLITFNT